MNIPLYYHPTGVMLVDDNPAFLNGISLNLEDDLPYVLQTNPLKALEILQSFKSPLRVWSSFDYLSALLERPDRFSQISAVVVDKSMPEMSGIEFCERLRTFPLKKILLTGTADVQAAVTAIQQGSIDDYIKKSDELAIDKLNAVIKTLQNKYFCELGLFKPDLFGGENNALFTEFSNWFNRFCHERKIVEYYGFSSRYQFLLLDQFAKIYGLIINRRENSKLDNQFGKMEVQDKVIADYELKNAQIVIKVFNLSSQFPIFSFNDYMHNLYG